MVWRGEKGREDSGGAAGYETAGRIDDFGEKAAAYGLVLLRKGEGCGGRSTRRLSPKFPAGATVCFFVVLH